MTSIAPFQVAGLGRIVGLSLISGAFACGGEVVESDAPSILLTLDNSLLMPLSDPIRGATATGDGNVLLWNDIGGISIGDRTIEPDVRWLHAAGVVGVARMHGDILLLSGNDITQVQNDGRVYSRRELPISESETVVAGARLSCGWIVASRNVEGILLRGVDDEKHAGTWAHELDEAFVLGGGPAA
jgi:hypothetical protein